MLPLVLMPTTMASSSAGAKVAPGEGTVVTCNQDLMPTAAEKTRVKVQAHRDRMRRQGLRLVQLWVPDTRSAAFRRAAHRTSLAVAQSPHAADDQAFVDSINAWESDE
mgnify:CR=1 FL=1